jgi:alkylation response protein AidB-like acyl-CoA dehydrogenase
MALAYTSDAYMAATHQSIQYFGAIGFSWEMKNHLYFKRARARTPRCSEFRAATAHA